MAVSLQSVAPSSSASPLGSGVAEICNRRPGFRLWLAAEGELGLGGVNSVRVGLTDSMLLDEMPPETLRGMGGDCEGKTGRGDRGEIAEL